MTKPMSVSVLLFALAGPCLFAQEPAPADPAPTPSKFTRPAPTVLSIRFPGGTMAELVAQVREREPKANIVLTEAAATAMVPAMELRGTAIDEALEVACTVLTSPHPVRVKVFRGAGEPVYAILCQQAASSKAAGTQPAAEPERETRVISLNRLTADSDRGIGFPVATILSAIEAATGAAGSTPLLRVHRDSGLLIVQGTGMQLSITNDVLRELQKDASARRQDEDRKVGRPSGPAPDGTETPIKR